MSSEIDIQIKPYWNIIEQITYIDELLLKGDCIIVPECMRKEMQIHRSHLGIEKCLRRAREILYWPSMNSQIRDIVSQCGICCHYRNKQQKESLHSHEIPERPWQVVTSDLFELDRENYVVIVDYYSKFFEVSKLKDTKSNTVIEVLKENFARHGIPEIVKSDNGPQYSNYEFKEFAKIYGFVHITSLPRYPQSNGMAERTVQTVKKIFKKAKETGRDPYLALLDFRNTPIENFGTPTQLLMGRRTRTTLPTRPSLLKPGFSHRLVRNSLMRKREKQKLWYKTAKPLKKLKPGDVVRMRDEQKTWSPAVVVKNSHEPRSYVVQKNNTLYRRNR
ncbi:uncharacterized protein K02A2.6-like [Gigantopelta aegis]|uniref:uncharacterized protein K02A2.6-like n=1 Tax=Gigantopelta aegis TaxID=1735272 RepID=UPI001B889819|nr:uncharacterized protein K02A2.6-like [Gigantopelta aegis]